MIEQWRPIPEWGDLYEVSNLGRVRSLDRTSNCFRPTKGRILKQMIAPNKYLKVSMTRGPIKVQLHVHYLVLLAFVGPRPKGYQCCHHNGKRDDN